MQRGEERRDFQDGERAFAFVIRLFEARQRPLFFARPQAGRREVIPLDVILLGGLLNLNDARAPKARPAARFVSRLQGAPGVRQIARRIEALEEFGDRFRLPCCS